MICPNCGNEIAITAGFCPHCRTNTAKHGKAEAINLVVGVPLTFIGTAVGSIIGYQVDSCAGTFFGTIIGLVVALPLAALIGTSVGSSVANRKRKAASLPLPSSAPVPPPSGANYRSWCVTGADRRTGGERKVRIEALSEEDACEQANKRDILVSECKCLTQDQPDETNIKVMAGTNTLLFAMSEAEAHKILCDALNAVGKLGRSDSSQHRIWGRVLSEKSNTPVAATATGLDSGRTIVTLDAYAGLFPGEKATARRDMAQLVARLNPQSAQGFVCRPKVNWPRSIALAIIVVFVPCGFGLYLMVGEFRADPAKVSSSSPPKVYELPELSFVEVDADFCDISQKTEIQKKASRDLYKGRQVTWTGLVEEVTESEVRIKHKARTLTSDVRLEIASSARDDLSSLRKGLMITYRGTIKDVAGVLLPYHLIDGRILSRKLPTEHESTMLLLNTEKEIVEKANKDAGIEP